MRHLAFLALPALLLSVAPARADSIYSASFSGAAITTTGTSVTPGAAVSGSFTYDATTNAYLSFVIGPYATTGLSSNSATVVPAGTVNPYSAIFRTASNAAQTGGTTSTSFTLDLEAATNFSGPGIGQVLGSAALLSQLDPSSRFEYTSGNPDGTGTVDLAATITSLSTRVPEPASLLLLGAPMLAMALRRRF